MTDAYIVYLIKSTVSNRTYVGSTNNFKRRLRQHNDELKGGAVYTHNRGPWIPIVTVHGFHNKIQSLQLEWALKHVPPVTVHGLNARLNKLIILLNKDKWTSKSPEASSVPLNVQWHTSSRPSNGIKVPEYVTFTDLLAL